MAAVYRRARGAAAGGAATRRAMAQASASPGSPLPDDLRGSLEGTAGADLSDVRVHTDEAAGTAARSLGADAYTQGRDIFFAPSNYDPEGSDGQELIAHEVAHTVQQAPGTHASSGDPRVSSPSDPLEVEADRFASAFGAGQTAPLSGGGSAGTAYRQEARGEGDAAGAEGREPRESERRGARAPAPAREPQGEEAGGAPGDSQSARGGGAGGGGAGAGGGGGAGAARGGAGAGGGGGAGAARGGGASSARDEAGARQSGGRRGGAGGEAAQRGGADRAGGATGGEDAGGQQAAAGGESARGGGESGGAGAEEVAAEGAGRAGGPTAGPPPARAVQPPMRAEVPSVAPPTMPRSAPPNVSERVVQRWVQQTGRSPADHHAEIQTELATITEDLTARQAELTALGQQLRVELETTANARLATFQARIDAGRDQVGAAFDGIGAGLEGLAAEAHTAIQGHRAEGETRLASAETAQRSALAEAYANAQAAVETVVTNNAPAYEQILQDFAGEAFRLGEDKKGDADGEETRLVEENDPSAHAGGSLSDARAALRASITRECAKKATDEAKKSIDERITPFTENLEQSARETVLGLLEPYQQDLQSEVDATQASADGNFESALARARGELEGGAETAHGAIDTAVDNARLTIESERDAATGVVDTAAESARGECDAAAQELSSRVEARAAEDASALGELLESARALTSAERPLRVEQARPVIESLRASIEANHEASQQSLQELVTTGNQELEQVIVDQEAIFEQAIGEQQAEATRLDGEIRGEITGAASGFGGSIGGTVTSYEQTVSQDIERIDTAIGTFNESADAGVKAQQDQVRNRMNDVETQLSDQLDGLVENIQSETESKVPQELDKKKEGIGGKVSSMRSAMDGFGTDETQIYDQLRDASYGEIELIEATYDDHYQHRAADGRTPLRADLHDEMSGSDLDTAINYLDHDRDAALKLELEDSTGFFNDDEERIEAVLRSASDEELQTLVDEEQDTLNEVRDSLGGCDLDTVDALLDTSLPREQRHTRADAIRLFDAMEGMGTDEAHVRSTLESAATPEQRAALRAEFNQYAEEQGWEAEGGEDRLDTALSGDFSGQELNLMTELAKTERDPNAVRAARLLHGGEGAGTDEHEMFEALDDERYAQMYEAAQTDEERARLARQRREALDAEIGRMSDYESVDELLDNDMGERGPITYQELRDGQKEDGSPITRRDRWGINLEREVAQRKLETGQCEPDLLLRYALHGHGTDEKLVKQALSRGGKPLPKARVKEIDQDYLRIWDSVLVTFHELDRLDPEFPEPRGDLYDDLGGDDWLDVRILLCGEPTTAEEVRYVTNLRVHHETSGVIGDSLMQAGEAIGATDARSDLLAQQERFEEEYSQIPQELRDQPLSELADDGEKLQRLADYLQADAEAYGNVKGAITDAVVTTLEIVGGVLATIATAGASSPVLAAIVANMIISSAGIALRAGALGDAYGSEEFGRDFVLAVGSAGIAATEAKAFSKLATNVANRTVRRTATEAIEEAGLETAEEGFRIGTRARRLLYDGIEGATRTVLTESANTVLETVTTDQFWEQKLSEALWGENSLGAQLIKGIPRHMAAGFVSGALDQFTTRQPSYPRSAIAQALANAGANTTGILMYVDSYEDAQQFWDNLLASNLSSLAQGAFDGLAGHRARAAELARDLRQGEIDADELATYEFLADSERRHIAEHMAEHGLTSDLPPSYLKFVPTGGDTGARRSREDHLDQPVTDTERQRVSEQSEEDDEMTLLQQGVRIRWDEARSQRDMLIAIENGEIPRFVARVDKMSKLEQYPSFGNTTKPFIFATEPADLRGLSNPAEAMLKVGWTRKWIEDAIGEEIVVVVFDTRATAGNRAGDSTGATGSSNSDAEQVTPEPVDWNNLESKVDEHFDPEFGGDPTFRRTLEDDDIMREELPILFDILEQTPIGAAPESDDPVMQRKARALKDTMEDELSVNELYTGFSSTMQEDRELGAREVLIDVDEDALQLTPDNHVKVNLGEVKQEHIDALGE